VRYKQVTKRDLQREARRTARLVADLDGFIQWHYGNPTRGRFGMVGYAENYAALLNALAAAATLRTLLQHDYQIRR
jgi:hypothetical protein